MRISDWSSDVCSSDLRAAPAPDRPPDAPPPWSRRRSNRGPPRRRRSTLEGSRSFFLLKCVKPGCDVGHLVVDETAILAETLFGAVVDPHWRNPDRFGGRKVAVHVVGDQVEGGTDIIVRAQTGIRTQERRVGKEWVHTC